jgi:hypothetical protein
MHGIPYKARVITPQGRERSYSLSALAMAHGSRQVLSYDGIIGEKS